MEMREILSVIFKPISNIIGEIMTFIGLAEFVFPSMQSVLTWPAISRSIPWYFWVSVGLFIWVVGIVIELVKYHNRKPKETLTKIEKTPSAQSSNQSGGNVLAIGANYAPIYQGRNDEKKESPKKKPSPNWNKVEFSPWNPIFSNVSAKCGIEIINNSKHRIDECYVELIALFEKINGEYSNIYEETKSQLPCILAWQIHNRFVYEKIELERTVNRYLAVSYIEGTEGALYHFFIKGEENFLYAWPLEEGEGNVIVELKVFGKIANETLTPKTLFIKMFSNGRRVTTDEVTNEFPKNCRKKAKS